MKRLMSVDELSRYLAMPKATIYTYVSLGRMPADCVRRIGRALRFEVAAVDAWVSGGLRGNPEGFSQPSKTASAPTSVPTQPGVA
jgi:excisionase family DNA binding protein